MADGEKIIAEGRGILSLVLKKRRFVLEAWKQLEGSGSLWGGFNLAVSESSRRPEQIETHYIGLPLIDEVLSVEFLYMVFGFKGQGLRDISSCSNRRFYRTQRKKPAAYQSVSVCLPEH